MKDAAKLDQVEFEDPARKQQKPNDFIRLQKLRLNEEEQVRRAELAKKRIDLAQQRQALAEKKLALAHPPPKPVPTEEETNRKIEELWGLK